MNCVNTYKYILDFKLQNGRIDCVALINHYKFTP